MKNNLRVKIAQLRIYSIHFYVH
jgi:hypothetical protein